MEVISYMTAAALINELAEAADNKELSRLVGKYARLATAIVDRLTFRGHIINTGTLITGHGSLNVLYGTTLALAASRKFEGVNTPWRPEREIDSAEAARQVREQCPQIEFTTLREYAHGWDNTVFLTDTGWSFRFARREIALPGLQREIDLLPAIEASVPLPIPVPLLHGTFGDPPWPFLCFRFLPGTELVHARLGDRTDVAAELGQFLAALHAMGTPGDLPVDPFGRADSAMRAGRARKELAGLVADPAIEEILAEADKLPPPQGTTVLSHGDLYARHILVDDDGHTSGIIDWGDLCLAVPAVDLAVAYSAFDGAARAVFFAAYGAISAEHELRARTFSIFSCASLVNYARDVGDAVLEADSLAGLHRASR